jgi:RNA polymerase sigma factor FliA
MGASRATVAEISAKNRPASKTAGNPPGSLKAATAGKHIAPAGKSPTRTVVYTREDLASHSVKSAVLIGGEETAHSETAKTIKSKSLFKKASLTASDRPRLMPSGPAQIREVRASHLAIVPEAAITEEEIGALAMELLAAQQAPEPEAIRPETVTERRDRIILEHLPLAKSIAVRVHENLPVHVDLDDLVHAGILGLFDAVSKFDSDKQVAFSSYAKHRIKGAILDSLRQLDWASRDLRRRHKQVEAASRDLAGELHRQPTEQEIAARLGVEQDRWRQMMLDLRNVGLVSASTRAQDRDDLPAPDFPSKIDTHPDFICVRQELRSALGTAMKTLPERYQKVVVLYYTNEMTMKEIGGILGINESRVSQIHKSALEKMALTLESNGISNSAAFAE